MHEFKVVDPPKWPLRLLRFFVKKEYLEEIEGDMEELFYDHSEQFSLRKARRLYALEILKLFRPVLIKNLEALHYLNQHAMFKNYFKVSLRGLMKNPVTASINIFGLAAAIGFCVFAYGFARWTYSRDQFHENKDHVFLATFFANRDGSLRQYGVAPRPLAAMLKQDFPQLKKICRVEDRHVVVKSGADVFNERIRFTDADFLEMFTFPLKWGTSSSLAELNTVILSENASIKYFGDENPVGHNVLIKFDNEKDKVFKVGGVAEAFPSARSMDFTFLINFENIRFADTDFDLHDWSKMMNATLVQVDRPEDLKSVDKGLARYKQMQNKAAKEDWAIASFAFEPLSGLRERTDDIRDDIFREGFNSNKKSIMFLSSVCLLMLTLACFNYINIAIVSAARRLKEIGVRKSIGASRTVVIVQFLTENMLITFGALLLGLLMGWGIIIPWFENLWDFKMEFKLSDLNLWIYLPAILFVTGIASGIYPAFYISKFQAVSILKGSVKFGSKNSFTKIFLGVQLVLACIFITSAIVFTQNSDYMAHRSWGYTPRDVVYAVVPDQSAYEQLNAVMAREGTVLSVSGSAHHIGKNSATAVLHFPDQEYEANVLSVDARYFETMGLQLKAGRVFNDHEGSDQQAVIVNEVMLKNMGGEGVIGGVFEMDSLPYEVVGVVKDFHSYSFAEFMEPTIFKLADKSEYRYLSLKVKNGSQVETGKILQAKWTELFPETPFSGGLQEDVWGFYFEEIEIHGHVWRVFACIAVLLASLGLYGLVSLNVSARAKEFSIRKVLGAQVKNIMLTIFNQYAVLFSVSIVIGLPVSFLIMKAVLDFAYKYHMPVTPWSVVLTSVILLFVLITTVSTQVLRVLKSNPVNGLKVE